MSPNSCNSSKATEEYKKPVKDAEYAAKMATEIGAELRALPKWDLTKPETEANRKQYENDIAEIEAHLIRLAYWDPEAEAKEYKNWVAKQRLPIAVAITAVPSAAFGAIHGVLWDVLIKAGCSAVSVLTQFKSCKLDPEIFTRFGAYRPLVQSFVAGPRMEQARNFAVMRSVGSCISCVMKKYRGKDDDVLTSLAAGFGTGVMLSLATGMRGPDVMSLGVMFALANGGLFKLKEKPSEHKAKDVLHDKKRDMFSSISLGLDHQGMNFNTGFFTGNALSLLTDHSMEMKKGGRRAWFR